MQDTYDANALINIAPCPGLEKILSHKLNPKGGLGNFTTSPTKELLNACSDNYSVFLLNGDSLAHAVNLPTPLLKVRFASCDFVADSWH
jgi:hypothetical protein